MMDGEILPAALLKRKAVVYIRQSTQAQVQVNLESQRRLYELVDEARRRGFRDVEVIDDDLAARRAAQWPDQGLRSLSHGCAPATWEPSSVSTPLAWPGTVGIGITCSSSAGS